MTRPIAGGALQTTFDLGIEENTCEPHPFRATVTDMAESNSCPPFFAFSTDCARRMAPAQVPQMGFVFANSRRGSNTPASRAKRAMVVDSEE